MKKNVQKWFICSIIACCICSVSFSDDDNQSGPIKAEFTDGRFGCIYADCDLDISLVLRNTTKKNIQAEVKLWWEMSDLPKKELTRRTVIVKPEEPCFVGVMYTPKHFGLYTVHAEVKVADKSLSLTHKFAYLPKRAEDGAIDTRIGTTLHFWFERVPFPAGYELARNIGMGTTRFEMRWQAIEQEKGKYSLPPRLAEYGLNVSKYILDPMLILNYGCPLYGGDKVSGRPMKTSEQISAYGKWAGWMAKRLGSRVNNYEIWNEPNMWGWSQYIVGKPKPKGDAAVYAKMLNAAAEKLKESNPKARVIAMATSGSDISFINRVIDAGGNKFDAVSVHPYRWGSPEGTDLRGEMQRVADSIEKKLKRRVPLWISEMGWSNVGKISDQMVGDYFVRSFVLSMDSKSVEKFYWYNFKNDGLNPKEVEHNFGMFDYNYQPKPSAVACYMLTRAVAKLPYDRMIFEKENIFVARFGKENQPGTFVVWSAGKPMNLTLNMAAGQAVEISSADGSCKKVKADNGQIELTAISTPVFLRKIKGDVAVRLAKQQTLGASLDLFAKPFMNLFPKNKPTIIQARIRGLKGKGTMNLKVRVVDREGKIKLEKEIPTSVISGKTVEVPIDVSMKTDRFGYFTAESEISDNGQITDISSIGYAVVPVDHNVPTDSFFGMHKWNPADWPIGLAWDRLWDTGDRWEVIEPQEEKYNWKFFDQKNADARKNKVRMLWTIAGTPAWAALPTSGAPDAYGKSANAVPRDLKQLQRFIKTVLERNKNIRVVEIWNEPNLKNFFNGTPQQYAEIAKVMYQTVKEVDKDIFVLGICGTGNYLPWMIEVAKCGALDYMDGVSIHTYTDPAMPEQSNVQNIIAQTRKIMENYGHGDLPIWNSETGYCTGYRKLNSYPTPAEEGYISEYDAAVGLVRHGLIQKSMGVDHFFIYTVRHSRFALRADGQTPKLTMAAVLGFENAVGTSEFVRRIQLPLRDARMLLFRDKSGQNVVATWTSGRPVKIVIPVSQLHMQDIWGNRRTITDADGKVTLQLSGEPVYLLGLDDKQMAGITVEVPPVDIVNIGPGKWKIGNAPGRYKIAVKPDTIDATIPKMSITSSSSPVIKNKIKLEYDSDNKAFAAQGPVALGEGDILEIRPAANYDFITEFIDDKLPMKKVPVHELSEGRKITIDGNESDWPKSEPNCVIGFFRQLMIGASSFPGQPELWNDSSDLSANIYLRWDENSLYGLIKVTDNIVSPMPVTDAHWHGDSIEIYLDARKNGLGNSEYSSGVHQLATSPITPDMKVKTIRRNGKAGMYAASRITDDGYVIEFKIDKNALPGLTFELGREFGFDIGINDSDEVSPTPHRRIQMFWNGNASNYRNASGFGRIVLVR